MSQRKYWCHNCEQEFKLPVSTSLSPDSITTCPSCQGEFVELIEEDDHPAHFVHPEEDHHRHEEAEEGSSSTSSSSPSPFSGSGGIPLNNGGAGAGGSVGGNGGSGGGNPSFRPEWLPPPQSPSPGHSHSHGHAHGHPSHSHGHPHGQPHGVPLMPGHHPQYGDFSFVCSGSHVTSHLSFIFVCVLT